MSVEHVDCATSRGMAKSALARRAMLAMFGLMAQEWQATAVLLLATFLAPTTNPGAGASVEMVLRVKRNGNEVAGKGIAIRQSVTYQSQIEILAWHADAMMASAATSPGMAPFQREPARLHRATSRIPITSRALIAAVLMALMERLFGRKTPPGDHANLLHVASNLPEEQDWNADATIALRAASPGMAPFQREPARRHRATSRTPIKCQDVNADVTGLQSDWVFWDSIDLLNTCFKFPKIWTFGLM